MTLQEVTDKLQTLAHHGHAQDEVLIEVDTLTPNNLITRSLGTGQVVIEFRKENV